MTTPNRSTPSPRTARLIGHEYDNSWRNLSDEEIGRWLAMYQRDRATAGEEVAADVLASTCAFLDQLIADAKAEQARRKRLHLPTSPARYTDDFLADLKRRIALDEMCEYELGARLGRKSASGIRQGPCPICRHGDHCFTVYLRDGEEQRYYCYRCQARGDAISVIMQAYGDTFPEAVARLCKFGHVPLPDPQEARRARFASLPGRVAD
jgi:hypothetical protein